MNERIPQSGQDGEPSCSMEEIRRRRLAYFQNAQHQNGQSGIEVEDTKPPRRQGHRAERDEQSSFVKQDKLKTKTTTEFHVKMKSEKAESTKGRSSQHEEYIGYTNMSVSAPNKHRTGRGDASRRRRRGSTSSVSDDDIGPLVKPSFSKAAGNVTPTVSSHAPQASGRTPQVSGQAGRDRGRWVSNENIQLTEEEPAFRSTRRSGDSEVDSLFSNQKWMSAQEIPALSLKESVDVDSVSVFKGSVDCDDLGLSTHRPESSTSTSIIDSADKRKGMRQRSMSSDSLSLGSQAAEIRSLLGEQKYREFVEKSQRDLKQLHKAMDSPSSYSTSEHLSRMDRSAARNTPTPPPQPPSPHSAPTSRRGPSPRRRLRSSSPQMVSRTLQDIARTREVRDSATSRNYEQVVVPHNITFSTDEIYRQAYGGSSEVRKSSVSSTSSYQDPNLGFWNSMTPRQLAGGMSPTSPHAAHMLPPQMHNPPPQYPPPQGGNASSPAYFYPQGPVPLNMAGQLMYPKQHNMFVVGTPPQSPDSYMFHVHPLSQSMAAFHAGGGGMPGPVAMAWQYGQQSPGRGHTIQGSGQVQGQLLSPWVQGGQQVGGQYGQPSYPLPHHPAGGDRDKNRSSVEHSEAVRQYHEERRQMMENQDPHSHLPADFSPASSSSSLHTYFASMGMQPPSNPPPPYHLHQPPASPHPPQPKVEQQTTKVNRSSWGTSIDSSINDDDDMTTITKVTATSVKAGGITERLEELGVDPLVMQTIKRPETAAADNEALEAMRTLVRVCPECQAVNKEYMTWCLQCGGVLIGVDPIPAKDLKKKSKEKRGGMDSFSSKTRTVPDTPDSRDPKPQRSSGQTPNTRKASARTRAGEGGHDKVKGHSSVEELATSGVIPVPVLHVDPQQSSTSDRVGSDNQQGRTQEVFLEYAERIEEEIVYDMTDRQERSQDTTHMEDLTSPGARVPPPVTSPGVDNLLPVVSPARDTKATQSWQEEDTTDLTESPESGRGGSAMSSPVRHNIDMMKDTKESSHNSVRVRAKTMEVRRNSLDIVDRTEDTTENTVEVLDNTQDNKDSGRPSSGEGADTRKPQMSAQLVPEDGPRRSDKDINEICEVINDPIIRGFIKNYLQKKPQDVNVVDQASTSMQKGSQPANVASKHVTGAVQVSQSQTSKSVSADPGASVKSAISATANPPSSSKGATSKKKGQKRANRKGHEAIDVEIFAIEEAKLCRSARSGANMVPRLNLALSSDEDDDSSERTSSLQGGVSLGASSDTSSPQDDAAPINYSAEVKALVAQLGGGDDDTTSEVKAVAGQVNARGENSTPAVRSSHNQQAAPPPEPSTEKASSNFQFLKDMVDRRQASLGSHMGQTAGNQKKKTGQGQGRSQAAARPSPTSKVRASIEAPPPNRRWMRSSVAWSSYHPRELRTRSSVNMQPGGGGGGGGASGGSGGGPGQAGNNGRVQASRSSDSLVNAAAPDVGPSRRQRPASADQQYRYQRRGGMGGARPSSAGHIRHQYSTSHFSVAQPQHGDVARPAGEINRAAAGEASRTAAGGDHMVSQVQARSEVINSVQSPRCADTDLEGRPIHRLAVHDDTLPLIPSGPTAALKIYDRCFVATPRDEEEQESKWLFLPDELWLHVCTYLPQLDLFHLTLTCKQLYRVCLDPQLWKRVTVRKKSMKDEWLVEIGKRHPVSLAMVQCHGDHLSENALREIFREMSPKLKELNFSRCSRGKLIGDEILLHASTHCRHLTHVDASWCHVTDVGLTALADSCHRLESLCLNGCQKITDDSLRTVLEKHGTSLRVLELFGCFSLTPASFRCLADHCDFLLTLNMGQCYKISDSHMVTLSASLSRVETLDLRGCKKLGDTSVRKIVRSCRRLRHLTLANCPLLSNAAIIEIATYSSDIRSLDVCGCSNVSDAGIQTLASNCHRLTNIDISSTSCTHRSVLTLAESSRNLECAKFNFLTDIHEKSLAKLIRNCKRLNTVHLYGCNVRDLAALKRHNRFINIEM